MQNKRFIAGALCPQCQQRDKIFTYQQDSKKWRACASCDFIEPFDDTAFAGSREIPTRVNQNKPGEQPLAHEVAYEPVKLIDPKNDS